MSDKIDKTDNDETVIGISDKESEIIDFINESLLKSEMDAKEGLKEVVYHKFGDDGVNMLKQLDGDYDESMDDYECEGCGEITEEWLDSIKTKMELFDDFIDDTYDDFVNEFISETYCSASKAISKKELSKAVKELVGDDNEEITKKIMKKILFHGINEGWLIDEIFV